MVQLYQARSCLLAYRGTSLIRNTPLLGPYKRTMFKALWRSWGGGLFLMGEVPLYSAHHAPLRSQPVQETPFCCIKVDKSGPFLLFKTRTFPLELTARQPYTTRTLPARICDARPFLFLTPQITRPCPADSTNDAPLHQSTLQMTIPPNNQLYSRNDAPFRQPTLQITPISTSQHDKARFWFLNRALNMVLL